MCKHPVTVPEWYAIYLQVSGSVGWVNFIKFFSSSFVLSGVILFFCSYQYIQFVYIVFCQESLLWFLTMALKTQWDCWLGQRQVHVSETLGAAGAGGVTSPALQTLPVQVRCVWCEIWHGCVCCEFSFVSYCMVVTGQAVWCSCGCWQLQYNNISKLQWSSYNFNQPCCIQTAFCLDAVRNSSSKQYVSWKHCCLFGGRGAVSMFIWMHVQLFVVFCM